MRWAWALILAGCGRLGFGDAPSDAEPSNDVATDGAIDAPGADTVFYMSFDDDPTDGTIDDTSGHGFAASCVAGLTCPTAVPGKRGMAANFNGTQYALIPYRPALATPNAFTVAAWVYIEVGGDQVAVGKPVFTGSDDSWALVSWSSASMQTCFETTGATLAAWACLPGVLPLATWYHLTGTWDGAVKRLYINGTLAGSIASTVTDVDTHDIVIGGDQNAGAFAYAWRGYIDELRFYDRALTSLEIQVLAAP